MSGYSDTELSEIRLIAELVHAELKRRGLPVDERPIDEIIASGAFKAAECLVRSKDLVTPGWLEREPEDADNAP